MDTYSELPREFNFKQLSEFLCQALSLLLYSTMELSRYYYNAYAAAATSNFICLLGYKIILL